MARRSDEQLEEAIGNVVVVTVVVAVVVPLFLFIFLILLFLFFSINTYYVACKGEYRPCNRVELTSDIMEIM